MRILTQTAESGAAAATGGATPDWTRKSSIDRHVWARLAAQIGQILRERNIHPADARIVLARPAWAAQLRAAWVEAGLPSPLADCVALSTLLRDVGEDTGRGEAGDLAALGQRLSPRMTGLGLTQPPVGLQLAIAEEVAELAVERAQRSLAWAEPPAGATPDADGGWFWVQAGRVLAQLPPARAWAALPQRAAHRAAVVVLVGVETDEDWVLPLAARLRGVGVGAETIQLQLCGPVARRLRALLPIGAAQPKAPDGRAQRVLRQKLHGHRAAGLQTQAQALARLAQQLAQRAPAQRIAIVALDRTLTRQVNALLRRAGAAVCDEIGWPLSTTRAAAALSAWVAAAEPDADSDTWLDALRQPGAAAALNLTDEDIEAVERALRRLRVVRPSGWGAVDAARGVAAALQAAFAPWLSRSSRSPQCWAQALAELAQRLGWTSALGDDPAGQAIMQQIDALRGDPRDLPQLSRSAFLALWRRVLERATFKPPPPAARDAIRIVSLADASLQPWDWCLLAGPSASNLPGSAPLPGRLSSAQRQRLGLRTAQSERDRVTVQLRNLLAISRNVAVFEREGEDDLASSPLIDLLDWGLGGFRQPLPACDPPLLPAQLPGSAPAQAAPTAADALPHKLSASGYAALRNCPYQFFCRAVLRLREAEDLEEGFDKRDYGSALHTILEAFHRSRPLPASQASDLQALDAAAAATLDALPAAAEPFRAIWPRVRDLYLDWLRGWEAQGWRVAETEAEVGVALAELDGQPGGPRLDGRLDRIDHRRGSDDRELLALDYKTQSLAALRERQRQWGEDTQLLFYSLLLRARGAAPERVGAAYLRLIERASDQPQWLQPDDLPAQSDAFLIQLRKDWDALQSGARLPALGEDPECERCEMRGLCRRDWRLPQPAQETK